MVARIRLEAEDATKEAFDSILQNASNIEKALEGVRAVMELIGESSSSMSDELEDSSEAMDGMSDDLDKLKIELKEFFESQQEAAGTDDLQSSMDQTQAAAILLANGFTQSEVAAMSMDERLQQADTTFKALNAVLSHVIDNLIDIEHELTRVAEEEFLAAAAASQAAQGIDAMGDKATQSAAKIGRIEGALRTVHGMGGKFVGWMEDLWSYKDTFMKLAEGVVYLAEQGNPAASRLTEKFKELQGTFVRLAETEHWQHMFDGITGGLDAIDDSLASIANTSNETESVLSAGWQRAQEFTDGAFISLGQYLGLLEKGASEESEIMRDERRKRRENYEDILEHERKMAVAKKQTSEIDKIETDIEKQRSLDSMQEQVGKLAGIKEVEDALASQRKEARRLAEIGTQEAEQAEVNAKKILALEARRKELVKEESDFREAQQNRSQEIEEQMQKEEMELAKQAAEEKLALLEKQSAERYEAQQNELEAAQQHAQKLADAYKSATGNGEAPQLVMETMGGGVASSDRVMQEYIQKKTDEALDKLKKQFFDGKNINQQGQVIHDGETERYKAETQKAEEDLRSQFRSTGQLNDEGKFTDWHDQQQFQRELEREKNRIREEQFKGAKFTQQGEIVNEAFTEQYRGQRNRVVKQARRDVEREIKSGQADDELYRMQQDFAQSYIEQEGANRGFSRKTVDALKQAAVASAKQKQETEQLAMEVEAIKTAMGQLNASDRRQAQRKGY